MKITRSFMKYLVVSFVITIAFIVTGITAHAANSLENDLIVNNQLHKFGEGNYSGGSVYNVQQTSATTTSVTITWSPADGATSYYITEADAYTEDIIDKVQDTTYTITFPQDTYKVVGVYPVDANGEVGIPGAIVVSTLPAKITNVGYSELFCQDKKLNVSWNRSLVADGYEIVCYNSKGKVVQKIDMSENTYDTHAKFNTELSKTNTRNIYYVVVKGYILINNKTEKLYGTASDKFYAVPQPQMTNLNKSNRLNKITLKWKKIKGATSYMIYVSTKENSGYKKVATVKSNSYTLTKFKGKAIDTRLSNYYIKIVTNAKFKKKKVKSENQYGVYTTSKR